jgi:hypothetical protein
MTPTVSITNSHLIRERGRLRSALIVHVTRGVGTPCRLRSISPSLKRGAFKISGPLFRTLACYNIDVERQLTTISNSEGHVRKWFGMIKATIPPGRSESSGRAPLAPIRMPMVTRARSRDKPPLRELSMPSAPAERQLLLVGVTLSLLLSPRYRLHLAHEKTSEQVSGAICHQQDRTRLAFRDSFCRKGVLLTPRCRR